MGNDSNEKLDAEFQRRVKQTGYNWERFDNMWRGGNQVGDIVIKRIAFNKLAVGWRVIVTALQNGNAVVAFHDVENLGTSGGVLKTIVEGNEWKVDTFIRPPAPPKLPGL